jgi:signal transduction histidine kinase
VSTGISTATRPRPRQTGPQVLSPIRSTARAERTALAEQSRTGRWRRWRPTTGQLISYGLLAIVIIFLIAGLSGAYTLVKASNLTDDLIDRVSPARGASQQLQVATLNQQSGLDGYALGREEFFRRTYEQGVTDEKAALTTIRGLLIGNQRDLALVDAVEQSAQHWRTEYAEFVIADIAAGRTQAAAQRVNDGKALFDRVRAETDALAAQLTTERVELRDQVNKTRTQRNWTLGVVLLAFLFTSLGFGFVLRNGVLAPLQKLSADTRRVSAGEFTHRIAVSGPADIVALGDDVEDMRRRITAELAFATDARRMLEEQAAELTRSNAELEQFAYVASHDLQEPLRKVASFCQLIERRYNDALDERGKQYIAFAVDGAQRMQGLINDLLTFSRVGRLHDKQTEVALDAALDRALDVLSTRLEEEGASVDRPPELPVITGETTLMTMLWQNLVNNAIKFRAPDRALEISIGVERDGAEWHFAVSDNGIGIDPQFSDKIFIIFQRLHTRDSYGGTGIGLALCKKIVEFHGGRIWLDTDYADGARLRFTLPVRPEDLAAADDESPADVPTEPEMNDRQEEPTP